LRIGVGIFVVAVAGAVSTSGAPRLRAFPGEEAGAPGAERKALVGRWKLNPELSEDPREKLRQAHAARGGGGGWGGGHPGGPGGEAGGRPGGGGWGGRHGGREGGPPSEGGGERAGGPAFLTANELTITNVEPEVSIVEPEGMVRNLHPDGKKYDTSAGGEVKARWEDDRLLVETKSDRGKVKETWAVSKETKQLTLTLDIDTSWGGSVSVKRVFDPAPVDGPR
jgi:hypothetical protein